MFITKKQITKRTKSYNKILGYVDMLFTEVSGLPSYTYNTTLKIIWLTLNIEESDENFKVWVSIRRRIMLHNDWVLRSKSKINISGCKRLPTIAI